MNLIKVFKRTNKNDNDALNQYNRYSEKEQIILAEFERRQKIKNIYIPTDDGRVRSKLRELGKPVTLFGEGPADRRDRLRQILSNFDGNISFLNKEAETEEEIEEEFYTEGTKELLVCRRKIAEYSLNRARIRIARQKLESRIPLMKIVNHRKTINKRLKTYVSMGSQIGADRPVGIARFSPNSQYIASGSWSGTCKLYSVPDLEEKYKFRGHIDKIGGITWNPGATIGGVSEEAVNIVTGGSEGDICLWNLKSETPISTLKGHENRVCRVEFHPSGNYIGSASFDGTWRLWDLTTTMELLRQEGHSREVYAISFQNDGALVSSGGLDAVGRVWDLRTGRTIMNLDGHIKPIQSLDFSPNGYQIASGSADDTIKIWDIRKIKPVSTIPAHKSLVSDVRFFKTAHEEVLVQGKELIPSTSGIYLVSSGYDGKINIWSSDDWILIKSLAGHSEKAMSVDVSKAFSNPSLDNRWIISTGWDRTIKLWGSEDS
ncbi:uncharacterized protein T551_03308 [Pneumocystis jirovecii RU7]|uniref:Pre-mRNA processing factor 4 (PRP4)-like domain-containing protein n=1 Tax=Pneumocystis jirovecii (strain RU7) TaxID=1408657 RepID=A0A0W4ZER9_PNEJ7|nr:uncharacterized protein T551_03308 [Pneumocystis jirovecii RU7]KTW26846.1 hypothetical protein T551_03308 [Pneumocystis jirovecii RU7]